MLIFVLFICAENAVKCWLTRNLDVEI